MHVRRRWLVRVGQAGLVLAALSLLIFCLLAPGSGALETYPSGQGQAHADAPPPAAAPAVLWLVVPPGFLALLALGIIWMIRPVPR